MANACGSGWLWLWLLILLLAVVAAAASDSDSPSGSLPVFPIMMQGTESALMAVHIRNNQVPEAQALYRSMRAADQWPHAYAMNALLNAYANNFRCVTLTAACWGAAEVCGKRGGA